MKSNHNDSNASQDIRVRKLQTATAVFKVVRIVFVLCGGGLAIGAMIYAFGQATELGMPSAIGIAVGGAFIGLVFALGAWFGIGWFLNMARDHSIKLFGPRFEQDLTGRTDYWDQRADLPLDSGDHAPPDCVPTDYVPTLADIDFATELTVPIAADGLEETLEIPAAMFFTKHDLRGNIDLVVGARDGFSPHRLTQALLQHLRIGIDGVQTRLSPLGHTEHDPDSDFSVWLSYSVTDMIGEFDRTALELWIDKKAADPGMVNLYWDDRPLGTVRLVVTE